jgi:hypothetical protein
VRAPGGKAGGVPNAAGEMSCCRMAVAQLTPHTSRQPLGSTLNGVWPALDRTAPEPRNRALLFNALTVVGDSRGTRRCVAVPEQAVTRILTRSVYLG